MTKPVICPKCSHSFQPGEVGPEAPKEDGPSSAPTEATVQLDSCGGRRDGGTRNGRRGSPLATTIRWLAALTALLATGGGLALFIFNGGGRHQDGNSGETSGGRASAIAAPKASSAPNTSSAPIDGGHPGSGSPPQWLQRAEESIVKIESAGGSEQTLGAGFIVDPRGLVATSFHVTSAATHGRVRLRSGAAYDIAGYAAVDPENDLALLALVGAPANLAALPLHVEGDPPAMSPVVAIGHPQGVTFSAFDGRVSRVVDTADLPEDSRRFLLRHMNSSRNHHWIQHTARISEGNSGGPLLNARGEVIGVNTWVNSESNYSYALHALYLKQLLDAVPADIGPQDIVPLERFASSSARADANLRKLATGQIEGLYRQARAMHWHPESESQYAVLRQLAAVVTVLSSSDRFDTGLIDPAVREKLIAEADQVEQQLRKEDWKGAFGQFTIVNDFAAEHVGQPMSGLFFFGTVERIVAGDGDTKGMFVELAGTERQVFISLTGSLIEPQPGTHCLILGICTGRSIHYGNNPLKQHNAAEVFSRTILPLK